MKINYRLLMTFFITIFLSAIPLQSAAQDINDYTAYPPFVSSAVQPNILLVLDHSGSMQYPAYAGCEFDSYDNKRANCGSTDSILNPEYAYQVTQEYYGYFEIDKYYQYGTSKFEENAACVYTASDPEYHIGDTSGNCISGNLMNWATMSRIDLLRKVLIGGKSVSTQANAHTLRAEGGWRTFSDHNLGCTFTVDGGSYPNLDHNVTIDDYSTTGTCGYLTVWAHGTQIWGTSDSFRYVHQPISGDFDVKLRIVSAPTETGQTYSKAGLMIRASTASNSQHVSINATYGAGLQFAYRATTGGATNTYANYETRDYPEWVRLVRSGNTFTAYYSDDGTSWTLQGSITVAMPSSALVGMSAASYSSGSVLASAEFDEFICNVCTSDNFDDYVFDAGTWTGIDIGAAGGSQSESCGPACAVGSLSSSSLKVDVPDNTKRGIIQNLSDTDNDTQWDDDAPRFGVMIFAGNSRDGEMRVGIEGANMSSFLTALQSEPPYGETPTGEALREAYDYFTQIDNYPYEANTAYIGGQGSTKDPWCESGNSVGCRKSFVLLISDGEWNGSVDPVIPARENFVNDVRTDIDGFQSISTYAVYTFGDEDAGRNSLQQTALFGDFEDFDSNTWPYNRTAYPANSQTATLPAAPCDPSAGMDNSCHEWDQAGPAGVPDGLPDNYYEAADGNNLEAKLIEAISDILKRASSGTAVSVLATSGEGEGAVFQAYFYPAKLENLEERKWLGYLQAFFVDDNGNMREDTDGNKALSLTTDKIIQMSYSDEFGTEVYKCSDTDGDGELDSCPATPETLADITPIWKGGELLWQTDPANRVIFTSVDGSTKLDFTTANAASIEPYLRAADSTEAENIINWTRGDDLTGVTDAGHAEGYRKRDITINSVSNIWKLGDVIYSTPTAIGAPMENYDLLYGDESYYQFEQKYRKRREVVYVGANDGMLHAFNSGCFDTGSKQFYTDVDSSGNCTSGTHSLGQELWSYIPRGILPHLKWNTLPEYTHVYEVDLKPKVTDVKIFNSDSTHPEGWGTILIGGYRFGGKSISWTSGAVNYSSSPEYYALDITDPLNPRVLWTFSDPDLGLSMSYPSVAKIGDYWYAIFGAGATNYDTGSNLTSFQDGNIFVLRISGGTNGVISSWTQDTNYWKIPTGNTPSLMADSITVDFDRIDYAVDVIYIGENYQQGGNWKSLMRRLTTKNGTITTPSSWELSTLLDVSNIGGNSDASQKITAAPSAGADDKGKLWTFFGTGQFYGLDDKNSSDTGAFYAVKDLCWDGACTTSGSDLLDVSNATVDTDGNVSGISGTCGSGVSTWANLANAADECDGWAMYFGSVGESVDFAGDTLNHNGERVFTKPLVIGGLVAWGSYTPGTDQCSSLGESNAYAVYYKTGTAYIDYVFEEQKEQATPSTTVGRVRSLGTGMPSSPSAHVSEEGKTNIFFQQSTGAILTIEQITPVSLNSSVEGWKNEHIP
jgi:type IV pilus assembly protein PilY1